MINYKYTMFDLNNKMLEGRDSYFMWLKSKHLNTVRYNDIKSCKILTIELYKPEHTV